HHVRVGDGRLPRQHLRHEARSIDRIQHPLAEPLVLLVRLVVINRHDEDARPRLRVDLDVGARAETVPVGRRGVHPVHRPLVQLIDEMQAAVGWSSSTTNVLASGARKPAASLAAPDRSSAIPTTWSNLADLALPEAAFASSLYVKSTSFELNGSPSLHLSPGR